MGKNEAKQRAAEEKAERIRTKDFFARIAPSTIKFYADHYIVGDSYRCAWAVREYPPSTDEQCGHTCGNGYCSRYYAWHRTA